MNWHSPLPFLFQNDPDDKLWRPYLNWLESSYGKENEQSQTYLGLPTHQHPGSFGFERKNHIHEGVDLYAPKNTPVMSVEAGAVIAIENFTGPKANSPWWNDTQSILIEGESGVVNLGELSVLPSIVVGQKIKAGQHIGHLIPVLKNFKNRPRCMLHLELYKHGQTKSLAWGKNQKKPLELMDPTPHFHSLILKNSE